MHDLIRQLLSEAPVVTDGSWATQLQERGLRAGDCPEAWNLTHPERVESVATAYVEAGSRIILSNTFAANSFALARFGLAGEAMAINSIGVEISREAAGENTLVFGSIGPTGCSLVSQKDHLEVRRCYDTQCRAMAEAGADGLVLETFSNFEEISIALAVANETGLPVVACFEPLLSPESMAEDLAALEPDVIGANCGNGPEGFFPVFQTLRQKSSLPIWLKPGAGLSVWQTGKASYTVSAEEFAEKTAALAAEGAAFVGGCCGTEPRFIKLLRDRLAAVRPLRR